VEHLCLVVRNVPSYLCESLQSFVKINSAINFDVSIPIDILIYIQQDAMSRSLFYLETALHVSGGSITHHQEGKQLYLQRLVFVTHLLLPAAIVEELN